MEGQNCCKDGNKSYLNHPQTQVAVVMVPFPAQGHLNQLLHLSHLITSYGLPVHYAGSSSHNLQAKLRLHGREPNASNEILFHDFQLPPYSSPPPSMDNSNHFPSHLQPLFDASVHLRQPVSQLLQQLSSNFKRIVVIHDTLMASVVQDVKTIPNAESYAFVPISAFTSFFNSWDRTPQKPFPLDPDVPKCIPTTDGCLTPEIISFMINQINCLGFESGRLYNTSRVIDGRYLEYNEYHGYQLREKLDLMDNHLSQVMQLEPFPAQGHLNQLLHLAHLITSYGIPVHYAGSASHNTQVKLRHHGWDSKSSSGIYFHDFQLPPDSSSPPNPNPDPSTHFPTHLEPLFDATTHLRQPISQLLQELSAKFSRIVVIFDSLMTFVVQDVRVIENAESYAFVPVSTFTMFFNLWEGIPEKPFQLDSDIPKCIPSNEGCLTPQVFNFIIEQQKLFGFEAGMLYNTSRLIEGKYVELLKKLSINAETKHFAIGPLNPVQMERKTRGDKPLCLEWLDEQDTSSVIYVSFGSTVSMTEEQITELAIGLERSGQRFIWVLKKADAADFLTGEVTTPLLPEKYEERIKDRGILVRDWAPQLQILAHPSIGGFMTHCGWNSCMESISMGVPMAAWPMHSDQPRNAVLVTEVLKVGTLVRDWTHRTELVKSTIIENVLRTLMASEEGMELRKRAKELGSDVRASVAKDGTSRLEMDSFISHITR